MHRLLLLLGLVGGLAMSAAPAQQIPIHIEERAGLDRTNEPVTFGVPFARGALSPETPVGLLDPDGVPVTTQTRPMALWDDGSVHWLKVDLQADVPANDLATYWLQPGTAPSSATVHAVRSGVAG